MNKNWCCLAHPVILSSWMRSPEGCRRVRWYRSLSSLEASSVRSVFFLFFPFSPGAERVVPKDAAASDPWYRSLSSLEASSVCPSDPSYSSSFRLSVFSRSRTCGPKGCRRVRSVEEFTGYPVFPGCVVPKDAAASGPLRSSLLAVLVYVASFSDCRFGVSSFGLPASVSRWR